MNIKVQAKISTPVVVVLSLLLTSVSAVFAATVTNTNDSGPGSLREAIAATPAGGTVSFALIGCPCTIVLTSGDLAITRNLTINGPGADQLTISGNNAWPPFLIGAPYIIPTPPPRITVILDGLKITNGLAGAFPSFSGLNGHGGGIISVDTNLTVRNSIISNNSAAEGGGISSAISSTTIINSTISGNVARTGGGISHQDNSPLEVIDSSISDNLAAGGFLEESAAAYTATFSLTIGSSTAQSPGIRRALVAPLIFFSFQR